MPWRSNMRSSGFLVVSALGVSLLDQYRDPLYVSQPYWNFEIARFLLTVRKYIVFRVENNNIDKLSEGKWRMFHHLRTIWSSQTTERILRPLFMPPADWRIFYKQLDRCVTSRARWVTSFFYFVRSEWLKSFILEWLLRTRISVLFECTRSIMLRTIVDKCRLSA